MTEQPLESALWTFALNIYGRPGVSNACVALQDKAGVDVNVLLAALFATFLTGAAVAPSLVEHMDNKVHRWRHDVVAPLRAIRRTMKSADSPGPLEAAEDLRNRIKAVELRAEQIELAALAACLGNLNPSSPPAREQDFAATLAAVTRHYGAKEPQAVIEAALAGTGAIIRAAAAEPRSI